VEACGYVSYVKIRKIRISQIGGCEEFHLLGYNAMSYTGRTTDFWREFISSIFRVDAEAKQRTNMKQTVSHHVSPKRWLTFNELKALLSQKIELSLF
jgi:hypothetical protein